MSPLGESSSLTSERVSAASDIINNEFLVVHGASQHLYKHPWCSQSYALAILLLPRFVPDLFQNDRVADRHDRMHVLAMQTLAMSCQLVFSGRLASARLLVALARLPEESFLPLLLDAT